MQGVAFCPKGDQLITMSSDRTCRVYGLPKRRKAKSKFIPLFTLSHTQTEAARLEQQHKATGGGEGGGSKEADKPEGEKKDLNAADNVEQPGEQKPKKAEANSNPGKVSLCVSQCVCVSLSVCLRE